VGAHAGYEVRVGVQRDGDSGMPQEFLHVLGMDIARQEQRGARVPEIVESYLGQARTLQERGERALSKVGRVDERPDFRSEHESLIPIRVFQLSGILSPCGL
jgi:hypothetical protein